MEKMMSFPNQKKIIIHQSREVPFLKIGIEELLNAYKEIETKSSFVLYLYLASNKDGFELDLSQKAFENATGYSKASYHRAVKHLTKLGYIYKDSGGRLNFATKPKEGLRKAMQNWESEKSNVKPSYSKSETAKSQKRNGAKSEMTTEIDNIEEYKENIKIDTANPLSFLKEIIAPDGGYISGKKRGKSLSSEVLGLWTFSHDVKIKAICFYTDFTEEQAEYIVDNILDKRALNKTAVSDIDDALRNIGTTRTV